jgi:uncharacterized repeat protein (TIGR03803 family)
VYKLDTGNHQTVLYTFTGRSDGSSPTNALVRDAAGNLYGTALSGGPGGAGAVFQVTPSGQFGLLHGFTGGADGGMPNAGIIRDELGDIYGTTDLGGAHGAGVVFKLKADSNTFPVSEPQDRLH